MAQDIKSLGRVENAVKTERHAGEYKKDKVLYRFYQVQVYFIFKLDIIKNRQNDSKVSQPFFFFSALRLTKSSKAK